MNLDRILGQHDLKDKIYNSIKKNTYPQSKIIIDKDGYGRSKSSNRNCKRFT